MMLFLAATAVMTLLGGDLCGAASAGVQNLSKESKSVIPLTKVKRPRLPGSVHKEPLKWSQHMYLGDITVGNPPQTITVDFDTGSISLWVLTDNMDLSCKFRDGSDRCYHVAKSHTHGPIGNAFHISWTHGNVSGFLIPDDVNVAGQQISQMTFGAGYKFDIRLLIEMDISRLSGVAGLSMGTSNGLIYSLRRSTHMQKKVFSIKLSSDGDNYLMLGGWDEKIVSEEDIKWVPVKHASDITNEGGFWEFLVPSVHFGGAEIWNSNDTMIAGTGFELNLLSPALFHNIADKLGASKNDDCVMVMPAADEPKLKDITFTINGRPYTLKPADYIFGKENGTLMLYFQYIPDMWPGVSCILGDPFLTKFYSIYDFEKQRIAFASYPGKQ